MPRVNDPFHFDSKTTKPTLMRMLTECKQTVLHRNQTIHDRDAQIEAAKATIRALNDQLTVLRNENTMLSGKLKQQISRYNRRDSEFTMAEMAAASQKYCEEHNVRSVGKEDLLAYMRSRR